MVINNINHELKAILFLYSVTCILTEIMPNKKSSVTQKQKCSGHALDVNCPAPLKLSSTSKVNDANSVGVS